jgi:hypothetical protein
MVRKCYNNKILDHFSRETEKEVLAAERILQLAESINKDIAAINIRHKLFLSQIGNIHLMLFRYDQLEDFIEKYPISFTAALNKPKGNSIDKARRAVPRVANSMMNYLGTHLDDLLKHNMTPGQVIGLIEYCEESNISFFKSKALQNFILLHKLSS